MMKELRSVTRTDLRRLTHEEIARLLSIPMPAVKAWAHRQRVEEAQRATNALADLSPPCPHPVHEDRSDEKSRAEKPREM